MVLMLLLININLLMLNFHLVYLMFQNLHFVIQIYFDVKILILNNRFGLYINLCNNNNI